MGTVLVTGGAGYVGSVCANRLLELGHKVVIVDDLSTGHLDAVPSSAVFYRVDIGDATALEEITRTFRIDALFHFAAKALIPESVTNPAAFFKVNVTSALAMLDVISRAGIRLFVFSSTAAVYGNPVRVPIREDDAKQPVNSYGETKLCFERALYWYANAYGMQAIAFRYFNASGATLSCGERHEPETHVIPLMLEAAAGERPVFTIYGNDYDTPDGTCVRDYVHVLDIAEAHISALRLPECAGFNAYNIGTGASYSVQELRETIAQVVGREIPVRIGERRLGDPAVLCADPTRLMRDLGWRPQHSTLENIVRSAWNWKMRTAGRSGVQVASR